MKTATFSGRKRTKDLSQNVQSKPESLDPVVSKHEQLNKLKDDSLLENNNGVKALTATITIKGEISFDGDYPEDETVLRLKIYHPKETTEEMTFEEFKETGCMYSDVFPEIEEIEQRLEFLAEDWLINWKNSEIT